MMEYKLEELFDLQMGKTPSRNNPEYWGTNDNKWISIADLSRCGKYIYDTKECLSDEAVAESGISQIPANTVVMSFKLSIGKTAITPEPMYSNEAIMSFRDKHTVELLPEYIYYLLLAHDWNEGTNKAVMGKTLNKATLSKVRVCIHPIKKQAEIVEVLNKASAIIEARQQELQKLDELIKARFVELFGDPVSDTKSWGIKPLKENLVSVRYGASKPPQFTDAGYAFIRATNIKNGRIINNDMKYIPQAEADRLEKCRLSGGELIIVRSGVNAGDTCVVTDEYKGQYAGYDMILVLKDSINPVFLNTLINTSYMEKVVKPMTRRAAQPHLNTEQVQSFPIIMVPYELQIQFADFVKQVDKSKVAVQAALDKAQLLFDSLMQEYFG